MGSKKEKICPDCKTRNPEDAKFCRSCGISIEHIVADAQAEEPEGKLCPKCNRIMPLDSNFCIGCGAEL
jgi:RNA polymerase subunit RPABC4/transcription elongation factor Spt4